MNAYDLADQVEMWGEDLLALNMKGGIPVVQGAKMLRQQADLIRNLQKSLGFKNSGYETINLTPQTKPSMNFSCAECGADGGHALYCVLCAEKFVGGYKESVPVHASELLTQVSTDTQYAGNGTAGIQNETKPTGFFFQIPPQTKPLSDEEIKELIVNKVTDYELCRAIEERHGIK